MAVNYQTIANFVAAVVTITTTTEQVLVASDLIPTEYAGGKCIISAATILTTGTGVTSYTPQIRRGTTIGGVPVGTPKNVTCAASSVINVVYMVVDTVGSGSNQYCFTITQNAAGTNGQGENNLIQLELLTG